MLGAVFLVVTGGEALYADMGHFGAGPIRLGVVRIVMPGLLLNYFGQGALLLANPAAADAPFYQIAPAPLDPAAGDPRDRGRGDRVAGADLGGVLADAPGRAARIQPARRDPPHVGDDHRADLRADGELDAGGRHDHARVGVPIVDARSLPRTALLSRATMAITTVLAYVVARQVWHWNRWSAGVVTAVFVIIDTAFLASNALKILHGGWVPIVIATVIFIFLSTWKTGREILGARLRERAYPFDQFQKDLLRIRPYRVPGTAIFMTGSGAGVPPTLIHNLRHNKVLHASVVLLTVVTGDIPVVSDDDRIVVEPLGSGFFKVTLKYGFSEEPSVPEAISAARGRGLPIDKDDITYFLGRETLLSTDHPGMARWRERLFAIMSRNAMRATAFFRIPPERVVELGMQVEL